MRRLAIVLIILFSVNVFAGYYKVYFKNGGVLILKSKPDFSKEKVYGITFEGKKVVFSKKYVNMEKTLKANMPQPEKKEESAKKKEESKKIVVISSKKKSKTTKKPLIITEATIGKKDKKQKDKETKKKTNPFMEWMEEEGGAPPAEDYGESDTKSFASEEEAKKYWRRRFIAVNSEIKNTETAIKNIQSQLNRLFTDKLNTDDNIVIMQINAEMEKLEKKKKALEKKLIQLKKKKEDLKEEARRAGALPGWYRDLI